MGAHDETLILSLGALFIFACPGRSTPEPGFRVYFQKTLGLRTLEDDMNINDSWKFSVEE